MTDIMKGKKKPQVWWAIKNGNLILPFTARITRAQCVNDFLKERGESAIDPWNKPVKVYVTEAIRAAAGGGE